VGEDQVDSILCELVKGGALGNDVSEKRMIFLDVGLLGGLGGVTEEQVRFFVAAQVVFNGRYIGKFTAVVR